MKMHSKLGLISLFVFTILLLGLTSCTKENPVTADDSEVYSFVSYGESFVTPIVSDATIETDIQLQTAIQPSDIENGGVFAASIPVFNFRDIFRRLNLTEEQKANIVEIMKAHRDCEKAARMAYFEAIQSIIREANAERKAIREDLRAGIITRREAAIAIRELNKETREKIKETGANETLRKALRACTETMIAAIRAELDEEQLVKFNRWLAKNIRG